MRLIRTKVGAVFKEKRRRLNASQLIQRIWRGFVVRFV